MATKKEFYAYALGYFHGRTVGVYEARLFNGYLRKWVSLKRTCLSRATTLA